MVHCRGTLDCWRIALRISRRFTRRSVLRAGLIAAATPVAEKFDRFATPALAQEPEWRHALSLFDPPRQPAGFKYFDYVNPAAPKAGVARIGAPGTFDNFNLAVGMVRGSLASGVNFLYDTLLVSSLDEISADYGLLAEAVSH